MPELPEVETVARQLNLVLPGRELRGLTVLDERLAHLREALPTLLGARFQEVRRTGKQVAMELACVDSRTRWLLVHLRMTGRLLVVEDGVPDRTRCRVELDRGALCFADSRRFGTMVLVEEKGALRPPGLDPLEEACTPVRLQEMAVQSGSPLKTWLLDQHRITGLGNIYVCEILHASGLSPHRPARSLHLKEWRKLHREMRRILLKAIALCGTTFSDFQDSRGLEGTFGNLLQVYRRQGLPCGRCGGTILRETQAQRGSFWCPACQG